MSGRTQVEERIVITKTHDFILWSCNHSVKFPRNHRFVLGENIDRILYNLLETVIQVGGEHCLSPGLVIILFSRHTILLGCPAWGFLFPFWTCPGAETAPGCTRSPLCGSRRSVSHKS